MIISQAIKQLQKMFNIHGDVPVKSDCPYCGRSYKVDELIARPVTVVLKNRPTEDPK